MLHAYVVIVYAVVLALGDDFGVDGGGGGGLLGAELEAVGQDVELDALLRHGPGHHHALVVGVVVVADAPVVVIVEVVVDIVVFVVNVVQMFVDIVVGVVAKVR